MNSDFCLELFIRSCKWKEKEEEMINIPDPGGNGAWVLHAGMLIT
jgi:hypothetical protein